VTRQEDGTIETDRPETEEKFRAFFEASGRNAFYAVLWRTKRESWASSPRVRRAPCL